MVQLQKAELIAKDLQWQIQQKIIQPGQFLSERRIAATYAIARGTVRQAFKRLEQLQVIKRHPSVGYLVCYPRTDRVLSQIQNVAPQYHAYQARRQAQPQVVKQVKMIEADKVLAQKLHLALGTKIYEFPMILDDHDPVSLDRSLEVVYVPLTIDFDLKGYLNSKKSLLTFFKEKSKMTTAHVSVKVVEATARQAKLLEKDIGSALLKISTRLSDSAQTTVCLLEELRDPAKAVCIRPSAVIYQQLGGFLE